MMIRNALAGLSSRDRRILLWSAPLVALLVIVLAARFVATERAAANERLTRVLEDIAWLQAQGKALPPSQQRCSALVWGEAALVRLAGGHRVNVAPVGGAGGGAMTTLTVNPSPGNGVIAWLRDLECNGAQIRELTLKTLDTRGTVEGRVTLRAPVT